MWYLRFAFFFFPEASEKEGAGFSRPGQPGCGHTHSSHPSCLLEGSLHAWGWRPWRDPLRSTLCPPHIPTAVWEGGKQGQASLGLSLGSLLQAQLPWRCVESLTEESRQLQGDPSRGFLLSPLPQGLQCCHLLQPCGQGPGPMWG